MLLSGLNSPRATNSPSWENTATSLPGSISPSVRPIAPANTHGWRLKKGSAHVRAGKREVQAELMEGASWVALEIDLEAGPVDLEAWFGGQLEDDTRIGAFYVEIERVGERRNLEPELRLAPVEGEPQNP